jgi:hypothetical protein
MQKPVAIVRKPHKRLGSCFDGTSARHLPAPVSGVLSPGQWTFLAVADAVDSPGLYNVNLTLPEPAALLPVLVTAATLIRRRRA